jgi:hypothetical protein
MLARMRPEGFTILLAALVWRNLFGELSKSFYIGSRLSRARANP